MFAAINLGEILWMLFVIYLMVMYFVFVITIIFDIFRSDDLSGWIKALWTIALILFPIVTMIIYLVVRGGTMGQRRAAAAEQSRAESDARIRSVAAPAGGAASELEKAKALLDSGGISEDEYAQLKAKILAT